MLKEEKREIQQLLIVARNYLQLGENIKAELDPDVFNKKVSAYSDLEKLDEKNIMPSAHLASSAIRLCTIDEKLLDKYKTSKEKDYITLRKELYDDIRWKRNNKSIANIDKYIDKILHFILRNNVVHIEEDKLNQKQPKNEHLIMQRILLDYSTSEMYVKVINIMKSIEKDLEYLKIIN